MMKIFTFLVIDLDKRAEIILLQELLSNSWPAESFYFLNGWILRFTKGITSRANSVLPNYYNGSAVLDDIKLVEKMYKKHRLPVKFQIADYTDPVDLGKILPSLGYREESETSVMTGKLESWKLPVNDSYQYVNAQKTELWFRVAAELTRASGNQDRVKRGIINRIITPQKALFIAMDDKQAIVGVVLGVLDRGYLCVFDLVVRTQYRRQGIGKSLMANLSQWALEKQVTGVYLQVLADNKDALALYTQLGMETRFNYRYLVN